MDISFFCLTYVSHCNPFHWPCISHSINGVRNKTRKQKSNNKIHNRNLGCFSQEVQNLSSQISNVRSLKLRGVNLWQDKSNQSPDMANILLIGLPCNKGVEHQYNNYQNNEIETSKLRLFPYIYQSNDLHTIPNLTYYLAFSITHSFSHAY